MFGTPIIIMGMHVMLLTRTRLQHAGVSNLRCLVCLCQRLVPPGIQPFLNYRLCRPARTKTKEKQINDDFLDQMPNEINMRNVNIFLNKCKYLSVCPSVRLSLSVCLFGYIKFLKFFYISFLTSRPLQQCCVTNTVL